MAVPVVLRMEEVCCGRSCASDCSAKLELLRSQIHCLRREADDLRAFCQQLGTLEEEAGIVGRSFALVIAIMAVVCHNNKNLKLFLFLENGENIMICKQKSCY